MSSFAKGHIPASELQVLCGVKRLGPIISGWKRTARTLGVELHTLLQRGLDQETGAPVYRITAAGIDALAPGGDRALPPRS